MFEQRRVQILFAVLFAAIIVVVIVFSTKSSSSPDRSGKLTLETISADDSSSDSIETTTSVPVDFIRVAMCSKTPNVTGYNESQKFCKCEKNVVSCDFTEFQSDRRTNVEIGAFWEEDTIKRICICGSPGNLQAYFGEKFLHEFRDVNRVDIYNMQGPVVIQGAFSLNFAGDLYMSKVRHLRRMASWDYGRGYDIPLNDTSHLSCCSKIETPKFSLPTFFMEDSTVEVVENAGINDAHLWSNIIFQNVTFNQIDPYGISLSWKEQNASFTNCNFHNLARVAIAVKDVTNLLVAHSTFHPTCDKLPIGARSNGRKSTIAFINNDFQRPTILEFDAKAVAFWFNGFSVWNNETFRNINATSHGDRLVSIEYNTVDDFKISPNGIPPIKPKDKVIFNENLIMHCSCDNIAKLGLPPPFLNNTQRCHSNEGKELLCHLNLTQVAEECRKNALIDLGKLCSKEDFSKSFFNARTFEEAEHFIKATTIHIESEFMDQMLKYIDSPFQLHPAKEEKSKNGTRSQGSGGSASINLKTQSAFLISHILFIAVIVMSQFF